jgi:hypothetical protein
MNILNSIKLSIVVVMFLMFFLRLPVLAQDPVPIIYDTDIGEDCDDAGALAVLHALADLGEAEILGIISCVTREGYVAGCIDAINTYYGRPDIPIGVPRAKVWTSDIYSTYLAKNYPNDLKKNENATPAVSLYRKILASQQDHSVVIVTVGFLRNLAVLMNSSPDEYSPLDGIDLIAKKVRRLVCMAGEFPSGTSYGFHEWNLKGGPWNCGSSSQRVVKDWPTPIMFSGHEIGYPIMTGSKLFTETPENNPVRKAYELNPGTTEEGNRHSWDHTAILYAVHGLRNYWEAEEVGHIVVHNEGSNEWRIRPDDYRHSYLVQKMPIPEIKKVIEDLMVKPPKKK